MSTYDPTYQQVVCKNLRASAPEPIIYTSPEGYTIEVGGENHTFRRAADLIEKLVESLGADKPLTGTVWRHEKTGGVYRIVGSCQIEATNELGYMYQLVDVDYPIVWVRGRHEFLDGRFTELADYDE